MNISDERVRRISTGYHLLFGFFLIAAVYASIQPVLDAEPSKFVCDFGSIEGDCQYQQAVRFAEKEYPEVKDLSKMFFTLATAIFVASLTFSEKILMSPKPGTVAKSLIVAAWISLLSSIVFCGLGLALAAIAFETVMWDQASDSYQAIAETGFAFYIFSGILFVWGLLLFVVTAAWSLYHNTE